jgi:hypothetical protein
VIIWGYWLRNIRDYLGPLVKEYSWLSGITGYETFVNIWGYWLWNIREYSRLLVMEHS